MDKTVYVEFYRYSKNRFKINSKKFRTKLNKTHKLPEKSYFNSHISYEDFETSSSYFEDYYILDKQSQK